MAQMREADLQKQLTALAANIRRARQRARISQMQLSIAANIDRPTVSLTEKGLRSPDMGTLLALAHGLGVEPADLLRGIGADTSRARRPGHISAEPRTFGENLRNARRTAGLSQRALCQKAGVDVMAISMYESGRRTPNLRTLLRLAGGIEIDPAELLRGVTAHSPSHSDDP